MVKNSTELQKVIVIYSPPGLQEMSKRERGSRFWGGRRGSNFLVRFGPLGPKLDGLVVTSAFADVNFVEKAHRRARRASVARFARLFHQKCELFLDLLDFASE